MGGSGPAFAGWASCGAWLNVVGNFAGSVTISGPSSLPISRAPSGACCGVGAAAGGTAATGAVVVAAGAVVAAGGGAVVAAGACGGVVAGGRAPRLGSRRGG